MQIRTWSSGLRPRSTPGMGLATTPGAAPGGFSTLQNLVACSKQSAIGRALRWVQAASGPQDERQRPLTPEGHRKSVPQAGATATSS